MMNGSKGPSATNRHALRETQKAIYGSALLYETLRQNRS